MQRDFTLYKYRELIISLLNKNFHFCTFREYLENKADCNQKKIVILRHDIDLLPKNALLTGKIENDLGVKGSYYFRIGRKSFNISVIKELLLEGHEIGYHYEELTTANGNSEKAFELFRKNLAFFRNVTDIKTICMHGSPLSKWDNKKIWDTYDYKTLGVIGDPSFDLDNNKFHYLTDTGRKWNSKAGVRDRTFEKNINEIRIVNTNDLINKIRTDKMPDFLMINTHSQRWHNNNILWIKEFLFQTIKNIIKRIIVKVRR